jgi:hypothetical protein
MCRVEGFAFTPYSGKFEVKFCQILRLGVDVEGKSLGVTMKRALIIREQKHHISFPFRAICRRAYILRQII